MRFKKFILPIVIIMAMLGGCDSIDIRDPFLPDQVPTEAKQEERLVKTVNPDAIPKNIYPRVADVPFKPKDFSPKPAYDHYMDQLEFDRAESETAKQQVEAESPALPEPAASSMPVAPPQPDLAPPQMLGIP